MQIRVLEYFVSVVESGSVTAAALACNVTQPAISRQLSDLEREFGVPLFTRTPTGLRPTSAGFRLLPIARDILGRIEDGAAAMRALSQSSAANLTVGCPSTTLMHTVAPFVASGHAPIGNIREFSPAEVFERVRQNDVDLGISTRVPPASLRSESVASLPLLVQVAPEHRFASRTTVTIEDLRNESVVAPGRDSVIGETLGRVTVAQGVQLGRLDETDNSTVAQAIAASGRGCAVVVEPPQFGLHPVRLSTGDDRPVHITQYAAWHRTHYAAEVIADAVDRLRAWMTHRLALRQAEMFGEPPTTTAD